MRQTILRVVCDPCGFIAQFELTNSDPLTATTDVGWVLDKNGWVALPKEGGSQFDTYDQCPACSKRTGAN